MRRRILNDPQKELQSIISHLEEENKQLQIQLREICGSQVDKLQHHRIAMESQLDRLKALKVFKRLLNNYIIDFILTMKYHF